MPRLVSVVIPCYNASRWVAEAVESCLTQTYQPIEVIVIDDGSTDDSLAVLRTFGEKIKVETGSNRGGNHARNRGFTLSQGYYIQFLDADDFLLSNKIASQVFFLEETGADVVYGDWRHQYHEPDGRIWQDDVHISGHQSDVLASLLAGWWVAPVALLWRREAVVASGGWDETLGAGQDQDFFLSVAMTGAGVRYQPGCHSIYRRYGAVTVSTANRLRWLENHRRVLEKAEERLQQTGRLTEAYRQALARSYFHVARNYYGVQRDQCQALMQKVFELDPSFSPQESRLYNMAWRFFGARIADALAGLKHSVMKT